MSSKGRTPIVLIVLALSIGFFLLIASLFFESWYRKELTEFGRTCLHILFEIGVAFLVAGVVASIFEGVLAKHRQDEILGVIDKNNQIKRFGFEKIYANRQEVFDQLFSDSLPHARNDVRIIGICVSLFKEADRVPANRHLTSQGLVDLIVSLIRRDCRFKVLLLRRYPTEEELALYGVKEADFYLMRERDEDYNNNFLLGARLKKIANLALGRWIDVLLALAEHTKGESLEERRRVISSLQIREYLALPSLSLYIVDNDIFVTPYLYKRHCSDIPAFLVSGRETPLYRSYEAHFEVTWGHNDLTREAISPAFVDLLIRNPQETLIRYEQCKVEVERQHKDRIMKDIRFLEDPDNYRIEEKAILAVLAE